MLMHIPDSGGFYSHLQKFKTGHDFLNKCDQTEFLAFIPNYVSLFHQKHNITV